MLKEELSRAIKSWRFAVSLIFVILLVCIHQIFFIIPQSQYLDLFSGDPMMCPHSLFNKWIGLDFGGFMSLALYWLFPLIAAFPFADSYFWDVQKGYAENILVRCSRAKYLRAKLLAVGISSALLVLIPLVLDLFLTAMWIPAITPQPITNTFPVTYLEMWSKIYYLHPWLYVALYTLLDSVFISTTIVCSVAIGKFCSNSFEVLLLPFVIYIVSYFACMWLKIAQFSPMYFLFPHQPTWGIRTWIIVVEWCVMAAIILCFYLREKKHDVCIK